MVGQVLATLTPPLREVVELRIAGWQTGEIAAKLGYTRQLIQHRIRQARACVVAA